MDEGMHTQPKAGGGKNKLPIIIGAAAAVLLCAYLAFCGWVWTADRALPNVWVAWLDVSGMSRSEIQTLLENEVEKAADHVSVELTLNGWSGTLTGRDIQPLGDETVKQVMAVGRENFFLSGGAYLKHLTGGFRMVGLILTPDPAALTPLLDEAEEQVCGPMIPAELTVDGENVRVTVAQPGVELLRDEVPAQLRWYLDAAFAAAFIGNYEESASAAELPAQITDPPQPDFDKLRQQVYTQVQSAHVDPKTYEVTDHVVGVDLDVEQLRARYEAAEEGAEFTFPLTLTQPAETKAGLEAKLFADLLGEATSRVGGSSNRKFNVKLSAEACSGVILMPGEQFSYNTTTGSRSADKGYLPAPVYVGGRSEDEVGGGICQTSSTIYTAVLHTTLEIVERHSHMYAVGYVPDGMDATVYFGSSDFIFKNNTDYPVKVVTESFDKGGSRYLTVKLYGTNASGRYAVPERVKFDEVAPTNKYVADETVPRGTLVLDEKQNAYIGRSARTYRHIYQADGTLAETQDLGVSKYKMRPHLYHYNPLDGDPSTWVNGAPPKPVVEPVTPTIPTDPAVPIEPTDPVDPATQPEQPAVPETPEQPAVPETGNTPPEVTPVPQENSGAEL